MRPIFNSSRSPPSSPASPTSRRCSTRRARRRETGQGTLLFVDEIHRFNRAQQDSFLPVMEDGTVTLVGATTENPSFELNAALLSRARVLVFRPLDARGARKTARARGSAIEGRTLPLDPRSPRLAHPHGGRRRTRGADARRRSVARRAPGRDLRCGATCRRSCSGARRSTTRSQDGHYNLISALHKSVRGSDPDAALYYLAACSTPAKTRSTSRRRIVRMAVEDIGLADPQALVVANAAKDAYDFLGTPEGELALAEAAVYLATAPKSNAVYAAFGAAKRPAKEAGSLTPPKHYPQRPDPADEGRGLRRAAMNTTMRPRRRSPARTISPKRSAARPSTIRPSAASSARSASGWITGRSSGASGGPTEPAQSRGVPSIPNGLLAKTLTGDERLLRRKIQSRAKHETRKRPPAAGRRAADRRSAQRARRCARQAAGPPLLSLSPLAGKGRASRAWPDRAPLPACGERSTARAARRRSGEGAGEGV